MHCIVVSCCCCVLVSLLSYFCTLVEFDQLAMARSSAVWVSYIISYGYHSVENDDDEKAKCMLCLTPFICRGKTVKSYCTSSMLKHLQVKHPKEYREMQESKKRKAEEEQNDQLKKKPKPSSQTIESCLAKT